MSSKSEWISPRDARDRLRLIFFPNKLDGEVLDDEFADMIANAIACGVSIRGRPFGKRLLVKIDVQLLCEPTFHVSENIVSYTKRRGADFVELATFQSVEIDWKQLKQFVRALLPSEAPRPPDPKVAKALAESVARHKRALTRPSRSEHIRELREQLPGMTEDQYDNAKERAIKEDILPADWGKAGRISNTLRARRN